MSQTTLEDAMATLTAAALEDGDHPSPEELFAYHAGKLAADAFDRLQEHLAWCSECARTVADLAAWPEVELRDSDLERTAAEEADDWQAIRRCIAPTAAIRKDDTVPAPVPFDLPAPAGEPPPGPQPAYGPIHLLAAALFLAVVGLSVQLVRLSHQPATLATPQANVFVVDLEPAGDAATREVPAGHPNARDTNVPAGMGTVVFLLVQDDLRPFSDHAVELRGEDGEVFWQSGGLVRAPEGSFSIAVPLAALTSDAVEIRLYGVESGKRELLATYRTRIERDAVD